MAEKKYSPFRQGYHPITKKNSPLSGDDLYKQYREQYEKWPKEQELSDFPTHLDLELSSVCNLHCPMCHTVYIHDPSFKKYKEQRMKESLMSMDMFQRAIDEAAEHEHFFSVKLNFRGESTVHPQIVDMVRYAKSKGVYDIMLNSNGNHSFDLIEEMVDAGLTWLSVSLDALKPETYAKVRAGGDFYLAYANAIGMCRFYEKLHLGVSFVLQKRNVAEKDDFVKFWEMMPIHKISIGDFYNPAEFITNVGSFEVKQYERSESFTCPQLWQRLLMTNSGKMFPCCHAFEEPDDLYLGQFPDTTIKQAWDSSKLAEVRACHKTGDYTKVDTCTSCAYPKTCNDGGE